MKHSNVSQIVYIYRKHAKQDERDKNDTPAILIRRTNADYRLRSSLSQKSWRINAIIHANKECTSLLKASFGTLGCSGNQLSNRQGGRSAPKRKRSGARARAQDECNYARYRGARKRGNAGAFVFIIFFEAANSIRVASALNAPRRRMHLNEIVNLYLAFSRTD